MIKLWEAGKKMFTLGEEPEYTFVVNPYKKVTVEYNGFREDACFVVTMYAIDNHFLILMLVDGSTKYVKLETIRSFDICTYTGENKEADAKDMED